MLWCSSLLECGRGKAGLEKLSHLCSVTELTSKWPARDTNLNIIDCKAHPLNHSGLLPLQRSNISDHFGVWREVVYSRERESERGRESRKSEHPCVKLLQENRTEVMRAGTYRG